MFFEIAQGLELRPLVLADPAFVDFVNRNGIEIVELFAPLPDDAEEVCTFENLEMFGYGLPGYFEMGAELGQRPPVDRMQRIEELAAAGVGQGFEHIVHQSGRKYMQPKGCMSNVIVPLGFIRVS